MRAATAYLLMPAGEVQVPECSQQKGWSFCRNQFMVNLESGEVHRTISFRNS